MKLFFTIVLLLISCSGSDIFNIEYKSEETTAKKVLDGSKQLVAEKRYKEAEFAYEWLEKNHSSFYKDSVFMQHIELYGLQDRYEIQLNFYKSIFKTDSVDNEKYVPHFYNQMGMAYLSTAKAKVDRQLDSATVKLAISYFQKTYKYKIHKNDELNASSLYYEALSHILLDDTTTARKCLDLVLNEYQFTGIHPKGYFKSQNISNPVDIALTEEQNSFYNETILPANLETEKIKLARLNKLTTIYSDTTAVGPSKLLIESMKQIDSNVKTDITPDSLTTKKIEIVKTDSISKKEILPLKKEVKKTTSGEFLLENTEE
jgi:hypothetical protein